jgi:hypothetical protein
VLQTKKKNNNIPGKEQALAKFHIIEPYCYIATTAGSYQVCDRTVLYGEVIYNTFC